MSSVTYVSGCIYPSAAFESEYFKQGDAGAWIPDATQITSMFDEDFFRECMRVAVGLRDKTAFTFSVDDDESEYTWISIFIQIALKLSRLICYSQI
jgi:hypothetical protein